MGKHRNFAILADHTTDLRLSVGIMKKKNLTPELPNADLRIHPKIS